MKPNAEQLKRVEGDPGWRAALVILDHLDKRMGIDLWRHVYVAPYGDFGGEIAFQDMGIGVMSHGERLLVEAAWSLFNGGQSVRLDELCSTLDWEHVATVILAIIAYQPRQIREDLERRWRELQNRGR